MSATRPTTITIESEVRDRLRAYCGGGISYSEAILRLMDLVEADRYFASFREAMEDPDHPWVDEKDFVWD